MDNGKHMRTTKVFAKQGWTM